MVLGQKRDITRAIIRKMSLATVWERGTEVQSQLHYPRESCQAREGDPGPRLWEWLERYGIKILEIDRVVKETSWNCVSELLSQLTCRTATPLIR